MTRGSPVFWSHEKANLQSEGSEPAVGNYPQPYSLVMATVPVAIIQGLNETKRSILKEVKAEEKQQG